MSRADLFFGNIVMVLGIFGPPVLIFTGWMRWVNRGPESSIAPWQKAVRNIALFGVTAELICFWIIWFFPWSRMLHDEWAFYKFWDRWMLFSTYSLILLVLLGFVGKGNGRIPSILSCAGLFLGLIGVDMMR